MLSIIRKPIIEPVTVKNSDTDLIKRVDSLTDDEKMVYKWRREFYSERWIAETMFISRPQLKSLNKSLCQKLGVSGIRAMLRIYSRLEIPNVRAPVDTKEIDGYVEKRTENEIQMQLKHDCKSG